jgi:cytochrome P450
MVLAEAMRLYPPAWIIGRRAVAPYAIGGFGVPRGSIVVVSQWVTHRDARWFPDPERFDPGRFGPAAKEARPKFAYFPFGGGPRVCIGNGFAMMEARLIVATVAQRCRLSLEPGQEISPVQLVTVRPKNGIRMRVSVRKRVTDEGQRTSATQK